MRRLLSALAVVSAFGLSATAANAAVVITSPATPVVSPTPGEFVTFFVSGNIFAGPISATFGHTGIPAGDFTDIFNFTIPQTGTGSGSLVTSVNLSDYLGSTDTDILSVTVNGLSANLVLQDASGTVCLVRGVGTCGANETWSLNNVPITFGALNDITVNGVSRGLGSFGGNATFLPIPEPATWMMMLLGFGAIGFSMRRRTRPAALAQMA